MWKNGPKTNSEWYQCIKDGLIICVVHETFKRSSKKGARPRSKTNKYPNMTNSKGFKLFTNGVKVWMKKS